MQGLPNPSPKEAVVAIFAKHGKIAHEVRLPDASDAFTGANQSGFTYLFMFFFHQEFEVLWKAYPALVPKFAKHRQALETVRTLLRSTRGISVQCQLTNTPACIDDSGLE